MSSIEACALNGTFVFIKQPIETIFSDESVTLEALH